MEDMANIRKIEGKTGTSYKITVTQGRDSSGKQVRHYMTWTPPQGMSEKRAEREAQKAAVQFENQIEQGFQLDNRQTFEEYARYVIDLKERGVYETTTKAGNVRFVNVPSETVALLWKS